MPPSPGKRPRSGSWLLQAVSCRVDIRPEALADTAEVAAWYEARQAGLGAKQIPLPCATEGVDERF